MGGTKSVKEKLWHFFEDSQSKSAISFRIFIAVLILISVGLAVGSLFFEDFFAKYAQTFNYIEYFVLGIFTVEFVLRILVSPSKLSFVKDKYNWIDFLAIAPFYLGLDNVAALRILRIFRILRFARLIDRGRILDVFNFKNSIIQVVSPIVIALALLKTIFWFLEINNIWIIKTNLTTLFTIIGFALGVVLSQKISITYQKYLQIENAMFNLHGDLSSLSPNLNLMSNKKGLKLVQKWLSQFMKLYHGPDEQGVRKLRIINRELYVGASKIGNTELIPFHRLAAFMKEVFENSIFILSKKAAYTPVAYDRLLQQITTIYLVLLAIFIPGITGMISVILASYLLYGMYHLTRDLDLVVGENKNSLIKLEVHRLENYLEDLTKEVNELKIKK